MRVVCARRVPAYLLVAVGALLPLVSCQRQTARPVPDLENMHSHADEPDHGHTHPHPHVANAAPSRPQTTPTPTGPPTPIMENMSVISIYTFDPAKGEEGEMSYDLREAARTRIVITAKEDPDQLYRILLWDWQEPGHHAVKWDGADQSGFPIERQKCAVRTRSVAKSQYRPGTRVIKPLTTAQLVQGLQGPPDHRQCDPQMCKAQQIRFLGLLAQNDVDPGSFAPSSSRAALSGVVTIQAAVAKNARGYGDTTGYGVRWMVDQQLVAAQYYEKESDGKFSYVLDTTAFRNGEHVLRVSCCDHYDHIGVVGTKVVFDNR